MEHPHFYSALGMFVDARFDDFYAIIRKRTSAFSVGAGSYLKLIAGRMDVESVFMKH